MATGQFRLALLVLAAAVLLASAQADKATRVPRVKKGNHELLSKLGLAKVMPPSSQSRKRLAVESRHHVRTDDSHMFVIKLPPNPTYYIHHKPVSNFLDGPQPKKIPVGFKSNGKPAKIYHWNVPLLKKTMMTRSRNADNLHRVSSAKHHTKWNDSLEKKMVKGVSKMPVYYVPVKPKKNSFQKYFPGNGKPHSFYVLDKSKKKMHQRLLP